MLMPRIEYHRPTTLGGVSQLTMQLDGESALWHFLAGGTDLIPNMKHGNLFEATPVALISLNGISELSGICMDGSTIEIGATTRIATLCADKLIKAHLPALAAAAELVATPQIRNMATIAGNIMVDTRCRYFNQPCHIQESTGVCFKSGGDRCHIFPMTKSSDPVTCRARFVSDTVPVLMLLKAEVVISDGFNERTIFLSQLFREDGINPHRLASGEFIRAIRINSENHSRIVYEKLRIRNAIDFPSIGIAGQVANGKSHCHLRFCVTGVGMSPGLVELDVPLSADRKEQAKAVTDEIKKRVKVLEQDYFPTGYRRDMIGVMVGNVLHQL